MKFVWFFVAIQVLFLVIALVIIAYLIYRRIQLKKKENFEKRDN